MASDLENLVSNRVGITYNTNDNFRFKIISTTRELFFKFIEDNVCHESSDPFDTFSIEGVQFLAGNSCVIDQKSFFFNYYLMFSKTGVQFIIEEIFYLYKSKPIIKNYKKRSIFEDIINMHVPLILNEKKLLVIEHFYKDYKKFRAYPDDESSYNQFILLFKYPWYFKIIENEGSKFEINLYSLISDNVSINSPLFRIDQLGEFISSIQDIYSYIPFSKPKLVEFKIYIEESYNSYLEQVKCLYNEKKFIELIDVIEICYEEFIPFEDLWLYYLEGLVYLDDPKLDFKLEAIERKNTTTYKINLSEWKKIYGDFNVNRYNIDIFCFEATSEIPFGKYKNKTIAWIVLNDFDYICWAFVRFPILLLIQECFIHFYSNLSIDLYI